MSVRLSKIGLEGWSKELLPLRLRVLGMRLWDIRICSRWLDVGVNWAQVVCLRRNVWAQSCKGATASLVVHNPHPKGD